MTDILDNHLFENKPKPSKRIFRCLLVLQIVVSVLSLFFSLNDVESIVVSGPLTSLLGLLTLVAAWYIKSRSGILIGVSPILISVFWFIIIVQFNWSPNTAFFPVNSSLVLAVVLTVAFGIKAYARP